MERLLQPRSVAIVGASSTPGALGTSVISNLDRLAYKGEMYLINPKRDSIGARTCLKSVSSLPLNVDAAVLAIPKAAVLETLKALVKRKIGSAIIFSAGFAEGGESGLAEQRQIAQLARDHQVVIEGPNCLGLVNYVSGVALTFVETPAMALGDRKGVAILSQSGAMAAVLSVILASREVGLSYSVSTGNEAGSGVEDYLEYVLDDPHTSVVAMIVEQFRQPKQFLKLAERAAAQRKSILLLHPGRSSAARDSAATHTGAMAGDYSVMRTQVTHRGVVLCDGLEQFSDVVEIAYRARFPARPGVAVLTESGAYKALTLDLCEEIGLALPALDDTSAPALREALPDFVGVSNPVDLTAQGLVDPGIYARSLTALMTDQRFGAIMICIIQSDEKTSAVKFRTIIKTLRELSRNQVVLFAGLDEGAVIAPSYVHELRELGIPYFPSPDRAFRALRLINLSPEPAGAAGVSLCFTQRPPAGVIPEYRAKTLLAPLGIRFPQGRLVRTVEEASTVSRELGFPVALKAQAPDLPHKSDAGGVILNLKTHEELAAGWSALHTHLARNRPGLRLDGILVEAMGAGGVELIVGGRRDAEWGPVVLVGFGGVQAEILKDVRLLPAQSSAKQILDSLYSLKSAALFRGFRGKPAMDVDAVAQLVATVGALLLGEASVAEIDLNPVIVYPQGAGVVALDALMRID